MWANGDLMIGTWKLVVYILIKIDIYRTGKSINEAKMKF